MLMTNRFELREPLRSYLKTLRNLAGADACALYLIENNMHNAEKKHDFVKRFGKTMYKGCEEKINEYSILKFIGVADDKPDGGSYWNFDYSRRPSKYIVFHHDKDRDYFKGEGITGRCARAGKHIIATAEQILNDPSRANENDDTFNKIHPQCKKLIALPIFVANGTVTGVLRMDNYDTVDFNNDFIMYLLQDNTKEIPYSLNNLTQLLIAQATHDAVEKSYAKLYKGTSLLDSLIVLDNKSLHPECKEILRKMTHLYFVFRRHTYIGHEEISRRVLYFTNELGMSLGLEFPFLKLLEQFRDQENLMLYDLNKYRDHFMHQFHVFILGMTILCHIGIDNIVKTVNDRLRALKYKEIDVKGVLRAWALIALFHDIAYLFQEYKEGINNFIRKVLNKEVDVTFDWSRALFGDNSFSFQLQKMSLFFMIPDKNINNENLLSSYFEAILMKQDHGVISALYLLDLLLASPHCNHSEAYLAAFAISMHNKCIFKDLGEDDQFKISFDSFPLEFLLIYCDSLAEWGRDRKKEDDPAIIAGPELIKFIYDKTNHEFSGELKYSDNRIDRNFIQSKMLDKEHKFVSGKHKFSINYVFSTGSSYKISFHNP